MAMMLLKQCDARSEQAAKSSMSDLQKEALELAPVSQNSPALKLSQSKPNKGVIREQFAGKADGRWKLY